MMDDLFIDYQRVLDYNLELKTGLETMFNLLPPGQKKQVLKNTLVKTLLEKFNIVEEKE